MKLLELQKLADEGYGDDTMHPYYNQKTGMPVMNPKEGGDTLARFVAIELAETFDEKASTGQQLAEARRVISAAIDDLENVLRALWDRPELKGVKVEETSQVPSVQS